MAKRLINSLQVFRGLAALAVVVHHASLSTREFVAAVPAAWMRASDLGALGVDFFFVLSVGCGYLYFLRVERPALRYFQQRLRRQ